VVLANRFRELLLVDTSNSTLVGRSYFGPSQATISAAFLSPMDVVFCNVDRALHRWDGTSEPAALATISGPGDPVQYQSLAVDRAGGRIAVMVSDFGAQRLDLRIIDSNGGQLASRSFRHLNPQPASGEVYGSPVLNGDVFSVFVRGLERRHFVRWTESAEPDTKWPPGGTFEGLGRGPEVLVSGPADILQLVDPQTGKKRDLPRERGIPRAGTISRDGTRMWVGYETTERGCGGVVLLDTATLNEMALLPDVCLFSPDLFSWSQDDSLLVIASGMDVYFMDGASGLLLGTLSLPSRRAGGQRGSP
jgi:hypothetical protein